MIIKHLNAQLATLEPSHFVTLNHIVLPYNNFSHLSFDEIKEIIEKLAIKPIDLIRKNEEIWRDNYKGKEMTDLEIIKAMEGNPKLIERPIVINERKGIIGRPPEKALSFFT